MTGPLSALTVFLIILVISFFMFRPGKGLFWKLLQAFENKENILREDVLKQLFHFEYSGGIGSLQSLHGIIETEESQLVDVLAKMESGGLIRTDGGRITLKPEGTKYALKVVRAHRLWEKYLADKTGIDKRQWHQLAELAEHKLSKDDVDELAHELGDPRYDPHGDPIPTNAGYIQKLRTVPLSQFPKNTHGVIRHIEDEPKSIYEQIIAKNIQIGAPVLIKESNETGVRFQSQGEEFILAPIVANNVNVAAQEASEILFDDARKLSALRIGEESRIVGLSRECRGTSRRRLLDLGFVRGSQVKAALSSPLGDPVSYLIKGSSIALRKKLADLVMIEK